MNISHFVPHINREASGPSYSVPRLCEEMAKAGHHVSLHCMAANRQLAGVDLFVHKQWAKPASFAISFAAAKSMSEQASKADIVHNNGLWSMINVASGIVVPGKKSAFVTSPRGTLTAWAMSRRRISKKLLWPLQKLALTRANLIHVTSHQELADVRRHGFQAPVAIIPNGIDLPPLVDTKIDRSERTLLYLGRIHPTKCVDRLLRSWRAVQGDYPNWTVRLVGPGDESYLRELRTLMVNEGVQRVELDGPLYGANKWRAYAEADLVVLLSHSENFGMTVAEALASGKPVMASTGTPWSELHDRKCGWWIDNSIDSIERCLRNVLRLDRQEYALMGARGADWMKAEFSWQSVSEMMAASYAWLLGGASSGSKPDCVDLGGNPC